MHMWLASRAAGPGDDSSPAAQGGHRAEPSGAKGALIPRILAQAPSAGAAVQLLRRAVAGPAPRPDRLLELVDMVERGQARAE